MYFFLLSSDNMFSPLALDLSPLNLESDDEDHAVFASSTPRTRKVSRSRSVDRIAGAIQENTEIAEMRPRSHSQLPSARKKMVDDPGVKVHVTVDIHTGGETNQGESHPDCQRDNQSAKVKTEENKSPPMSPSTEIAEIDNIFNFQTNIPTEDAPYGDSAITNHYQDGDQCDSKVISDSGKNKNDSNISIDINEGSNNKSSSENNVENSNNNNRDCSDIHLENSNNANSVKNESGNNENIIESVVQSPSPVLLSTNQRMYRPRLVTQHYNHQHTTPSQQILQPGGRVAMTAAQHQSKHLGRYMSGANLALPSRAVMYTPNTHVNFTPRGRDRERTPRAQKKTASSSSASSKMKIIRNRSNSPQVATTQRPHRDREFLKAIENSVARRQRAQRMSVYQLPDQDDDVWNIS